MQFQMRRNVDCECIHSTSMIIIIIIVIIIIIYSQDQTRTTVVLEWFCGLAVLGEKEPNLKIKTLVIFVLFILT